jgi:hypothetical protein
MDKFYLLDIISNDYDLLKKSFCGKTDTKVINSNAETIDDIFQNRLLFLLEDYNDFGLDYQAEFDYVLMALRTYKPCQPRQIRTVEYNDNHDPYLNEAEKDYSDKLQLLLIHYNPNAFNKKVSKAKIQTRLLERSE